MKPSFALQLPKKPGTAALAIVALAFPILLVPGSPSIAPQLAWSADRTSTSLATFTMIYAVIALSFGSLMRLSGLPSVAHGALWGVGAYTAGILFNDQNWSFLAALPLAILIPAIIAGLIGIPAFRTTGVAFLVITIGLGEFIVLVLTNATDLTNGTVGLNVIGFPGSFLGLTLADPHERYYVALIFLYVAIAAIFVVTRSRFGRRLEMIRDNEPLAKSIGLDPRLYKLGIFSLTAALTGAAGQLYMWHQQAVTPDLFATFRFIPIILMAVLGGVGTIIGPVIGAYLVSFAPTWLETTGIDEPNTRELIYGAVLILVMVVAPSGISGIVAAAARRVARLFARRAPGTDAGGMKQPETIAAPAPSHQPVVRTAPNGSEILVVRDLCRDYGAVRALDSVSLSVRTGEILGVIGPNGSGKTTLFNCISGFVSSRGTVEWDGRPIRKTSPQRLARRGLVRTFQHPSTFMSMTPREACAQVEALRRSKAHVDNNLPDDPDELVQFCRLAHVADLPVGMLTYGQLRLSGVALALAAQPSILMLDEPGAGLNDSECEVLRDVLKAANAAGVTLVVVDHDMTFLLPLCDRVVVMDAGQVITEGLPSTVTRDPRVVAAYLGERFVEPLGLSVD